MKKIWFENPAREWNEALPIGNGKLGAMVFGSIEEEHYQLNEDSVWYGAPINRINPEAYPNLEKVRNHILNGNIVEAEELLSYAFSGIPQSQRPYQPLGDLRIIFKNHQSLFVNYRRELNLEDSIHRVHYQQSDEGDIIFERECFSSYPDDVIVIHFKTNAKAGISFSCLLTRERFYDQTWAIDKSTIAMNGNLGKGGIDFCTTLRAITENGEVQTCGEHLIVENAKEVTLILAATTSFRNNNPLQYCEDILNSACAFSYKLLKERHQKDYSELFSRVTLNLSESNKNSEIATDKRLANYRYDQSDVKLIGLMYHFGRYLLISSSRPGALPSNLQGIWNNHMLPPWDSKFTININTEMNYWPSLTANLAECQIPLFDLLSRLVTSGRKTAKEMYNCRGFVAHHNTDIWADTAPQDIYIPSTYWVMGGAWLSLHIWQHFLYTQDIEFLKKYYYILEEAALFFEDYLIFKDGYLLTCPSVSPENTYKLPDGTQGRVCFGAAMDNQILKDLFEACIDGGKILGVSDHKLATFRSILAKIPPIRIGKHGQIMEWMEDYDEVEPGHRHISQLYALYPSHQITKDQTPELSKAASKTLARRLKHGGGHTGWSSAWIINLFSRLWDGEACYENINKFLINSTLPNLFGSHPPFQIDGNFGIAAAIIEMLVQSNNERVVLLPALPKVWVKGELSGIKLVGNASLSMRWSEGKIRSFKILAMKPYCSTIFFKLNPNEDFKKVKIQLCENEEYVFPKGVE